MKQKEFLWVVPKWPFPMNDGARQATVQLLRHITQLGVRVSLLAIVPQDEDIRLQDAHEKLGVVDVQLYRRPNASQWRHLWNFIREPFRPITLAPYAQSAVYRDIQAKIQSMENPIVVFDGLHAAACLHTIEDPGFDFSYRAHNVESELWRSAAQKRKNPIFRLFLWFQANLMAKFERKICEQSLFVFPVSDEDKNIFEKITKRRITTLRIGMAPKLDPRKMEFVQEEDRDLRLLFVGRLDWPPNHLGLKWFLENIWPAVSQAKPSITLTIIGSGNGAWLKAALQFLQKIQFLGMVEDLTPYYEACDACLVPIFFGSGTRVKAIEASLYGKLCISTRLGVEGLGLVPKETYLEGESVEDWLQILRSTTPKQAREIGLRSYQHISSAFDPVKIAKIFLDSFEET